MALGAYQWHIPKAQVDEASKMILLEAANSTDALSKSTCPTKVVKGQYGQLTFSGAYINSKGKSCPSGCKVQYSFDSKAHNQLKNKILVADILNNSKTALNSSTTIANRLVPSVLASGAVSAGDNCAAQTITDPTKTDGDVNGSEVGDVDPVLPPTPGGGGSNPVNPVDPTDPTKTDPTSPDGSGGSTPDLSANEIPGLPVMHGNWKYTTSGVGYPQGIVPEDRRRVLNFIVKDLNKNENYPIWGTYVGYNLEITVNLGVEYANKSVQASHRWFYYDSDYPTLLSNSGSGSANLVADSKGFIKYPSFYTEGTLYAHGGTYDTIAVTYNGGQIYRGVMNIGTIYMRK